MVDNIPAYGCSGLLINKKVKSVFDGLPVDNIQYFDARLIDQATQKVLVPYWIANIIGKVACVDRAGSSLVCFDDGQIQFIDKLVLLPMTDGQHGHIFRLAEFLPAIVISDALKEALTDSGVTGFTYYKPEEFSL